ncbi:NAD(P)-binding protein [Ramaria rubella]|nr:NAD(P)-binding protein [Ramaria rubella]
MSTIFVVGAGPKIGLQVPKLFVSKGFTSVGLASRSKSNLETLATQLPQSAKVAIAEGTDAGEAESLVRGLESMKQSLGKPDVVVFNASSLFLEHKALMDMSAGDFEAHLRGTLVSGFVVGQWAVKNLNRNAAKPPAVLFTGGGLGHQPRQNHAGLAAGKAGLLNVCKAFQLEHPDIHFAVVTVKGLVDKGNEYYSSPLIAQRYWDLYEQRKEDWQVEVEH